MKVVLGGSEKLLVVSVILAADPSPDSLLKAYEVSLSAPTPHSSTLGPISICFSSYLSSFCYLEGTTSQGPSCHYSEGMCVFPFLGAFHNMSQSSLLCLFHLSYHQMINNYEFSNESGSLSLIQWLKVLPVLDIKLLLGILCHPHCIWQPFLTLIMSSIAL